MHYPAPQGKGLPAWKGSLPFFYSPIPERAPNPAGFYPFTAALSTAGPSPAKKPSQGSKSGGQPALSPLWGSLSGPMGTHFRAGFSHPIPWRDPSPCSRCPHHPREGPSGHALAHPKATSPVSSPMGFVFCAFSSPARLTELGGGQEIGVGGVLRTFVGTFEAAGLIAGWYWGDGEGLAPPEPQAPRLCSPRSPKVIRDALST